MLCLLYRSPLFLRLFIDSVKNTHFSLFYFLQRPFQNRQKFGLWNLNLREIWNLYTYIVIAKRIATYLLVQERELEVRIWILKMLRLHSDS